VISFLRRHGFVLAVYILALLVTEAYYQGDIAEYAAAVLGHLHGPVGRWDPLWEFGHLLWRPLGLVLLFVAHWISPSGFGLPDHLLLTSLLMWTSRIAGLGFALLLDSMLLDISGSRLVAALVTSFAIVSNAFLNYSQTGSSYVTGLSLTMLGIWSLQKATRSGLPFGLAMLAGAVLAASALFWFPYVFVIPAAFLIPLVFPYQDSRRTARFLATAMGCCIVLLAGAYILVLLHLHVGSAAELKTWVMEASHGQKQLLRTNVLRMVFGVPRSFIEMGDLGKVLKRLLFHDPYNPVRLSEAGVLPLLLFYLAAAAIFYSAWESSEGRKIVLVSIAAILPVTLFSLFIFESGSQERYFPLYPFLFWTAALALKGARKAARVAVICGSVLFAVVLFTSIPGMSATRGRELRRIQATRISAFAQQLGPGFLTILNNQDPLMLFSKTYPFDPLNQPSAVPVHDVIEIGRIGSLTWQQDFAQRTLASWDSGGEVWVSKRLTSSRPQPSWNWVEGEDPHVHWIDLGTFFRQCRYTRDSGGDDGFLFLPPSGENRRLLTNILNQPVARSKY